MASNGSPILNDEDRKKMKCVNESMRRKKEREAFDDLKMFLHREDPPSQNTKMEKIDVLKGVYGWCVSQKEIQKNLTLENARLQLQLGQALLMVQQYGRQIEGLNIMVQRLNETLENKENCPKPSTPPPSDSSMFFNSPDSGINSPPDIKSSTILQPKPLKRLWTPYN